MKRPDVSERELGVISAGHSVAGSPIDDCSRGQNGVLAGFALCDKNIARPLSDRVHTTMGARDPIPHNVLPDVKSGVATSFVAVR